MFLKCSERRKDGKVHRSWSIVESRRYAGGKVAQQHVLYLGEIDDSQRVEWERTVAVFDEREGETRQLALFPADRTPPLAGAEAVQVRLDAMRLERPRQWGACWLGDHLWRTLHLDDFFGARLPVTREDTDWAKVLRILAIYRLLSPGSEWRLHRQWFGTTALGDLLGVDARAVQDDNGGSPRRAARSRFPGEVSGRHPQGPTHAVRGGVGGKTLAGGAATTASQTVGARE